MTPETIAELRRLAEAATPGPWSYFGPDQHGCDPCIESADHYVTDLHATDEDAAYIVAANPATVLALLAERDALGLRGDLLARDLGAAVVRADRAAAERDALAAGADKWQRAALTLQGDRDALTDERDSLSWQVEALRAERDARSAERDALAAKAERVRTLASGMGTPRPGADTDRDSVLMRMTLRTAGHRILRALDEEAQP